MMDSAKFFPGFAERRIAVGDVMLHARIGGAGPPLVLLHGYPQSHVMWRRVAPELAKRFTTVVPDLRGYGLSSAPASRKGEGYAKRVMGADVVALMQALGHKRFSLAGYDRGGRVGYRLALDHPERIERLAVLDIIPTGEMWRGMDAARAMSVYHWMFLAQPEPLPEMLIARAPREYIDHTLASWTATKSLDCFWRGARRLSRGFCRSRAHSCDVRRLSRGRDDRPHGGRSRSRGGPKNCRSVACPVGRARNSGGGNQSPRRLAPMGERRSRSWRSRRPLPAGGGARGDGERPAGFLHVNGAFRPRRPAFNARAKT